MVDPSDKEYLQTKTIKQGKASLDQDFILLAEYIGLKYGTVPLNIIYDTIDGKRRPRVQVVFEYQKDYSKFITPLGYDAERQKEIAQQFDALVNDQSSSSFLRLAPKKYDSSNVWIAFSCFESIARIEANERITEKEIESLQSGIDNPDLWKISRCFNSVTFLFYTEQQAREYSENALIKGSLKNMYFEILKAYDEFGYIAVDSFPYHFDSKENFDKNYQSNWLYYYR